MENTNTTKGPLDQDENKNLPPEGGAAGATNGGDDTTQKLPEAGAVIKKDDKKKKTVEVDAETLEKVLGRLEKVEKDNLILREVADKNRLTRVEEMRAQGKLVKKVKLNTYEGKIIMGWKTVKDDVYMDQEGRLHENQIIGIFFEGEKEVGKELDIRAFSRLIVKIPVEVLEESKDREGNTNFVVTTSDGRELKIDSRFIN